jgi:hypothetical protein
MALLGSTKINEKPGVACGFQALFRSCPNFETVAVAVELQLQAGKSERVRFNGQCSEPQHVSHIYICRHSQFQELGWRRRKINVMPPLPATSQDKP